MSHNKIVTLYQPCHARPKMGTVKHPTLTRREIEGLAGFLDMELSQVAIGITPVIVPHAVGDIARLLNLDQEIAGTDIVNLTCRDIENIPRPRCGGVDDIQNRTIIQEANKFGFRQLSVEASAYQGVLIGIKDIPHFILGRAVVTPVCHFIVRMHLDREVTMGINKLDK